MTGSRAQRKVILVSLLGVVAWQVSRAYMRPDAPWGDLLGLAAFYLGKGFAIALAVALLGTMVAGSVIVWRIWTKTGWPHVNRGK